MVLEVSGFGFRVSGFRSMVQVSGLREETIYIHIDRKIDIRMYKYIYIYKNTCIYIYALRFEWCSAASAECLLYRLWLLRRNVKRGIVSSAFARGVPR